MEYNVKKFFLKNFQRIIEILNERLENRKSMQRFRHCSAEDIIF